MAVGKRMASDGYGVDKNGRYIRPRWVWDANMENWWYRYSNGSWPKSSWKKIGGDWHYFGPDGYLYYGGLFYDGDHSYVVDLFGRYLDWAKLPDRGSFATRSLYRSSEGYFEQFTIHYQNSRVLAIERSMIPEILEPYTLSMLQADLKKANAYYGICAQYREFSSWDQARGLYYIQMDNPAAVSNALKSKALGVAMISNPNFVAVEEVVQQLH